MGRYGKACHHTPCSHSRGFECMSACVHAAFYVSVHRGRCCRIVLPLLRWNQLFVQVDKSEPIRTQWEAARKARDKQKATLVVAFACRTHRARTGRCLALVGAFAGVLFTANMRAAFLASALTCTSLDAGCAWQWLGGFAVCFGNNLVAHENSSKNKNR